jgi:hypothetical protein
LDENIDIAAMGECATNAQLREAFQIVALWEKYHARPANVSKQAEKVVGTMLRRRVRSHEERLNRLLLQSLGQIPREVRKFLFGAITRLNPQPFRDIATAIECVRNINERGAFQTMVVRAALLAQERFGISRATRLPVTVGEFAKLYQEKFGGNVNADFLRRECEQKIGFTFNPGKAGPKPKNSANSSRPT